MADLDAAVAVGKMRGLLLSRIGSVPVRAFEAGEFGLMDKLFGGEPMTLGEIGVLSSKVDAWWANFSTDDEDERPDHESDSTENEPICT